MTDIVPELYEQIEKDFLARVRTAPDIRVFMKKLEAGKAAPNEVSQYAGRLGDCASAALISGLREENLSDGRLYWNIAQRTVRPILQLVHKMVNDAAIQVQMIEDKKIGIGLKPIRADFPEERVNSLIRRMVDEFDKMGDQGTDE